MLVTQANFDQALLKLQKEKVLGFDTETTLLNWWKSPWYDFAPRVFSMQFSTEKEDFYFDFNHSSDKLSDKHFQKIAKELTEDPERLWFIANAKFDLHHCANHDVKFAGTIHCTKAIARVCNNLEPSLSLDSLSEKYLGVGKNDVIALIKERGLVTKIKKFGHNDKFEEILHFDRLELGELVDYGQKDTRLCFDLGVWQIKKILQTDLDIFSDKAVKLKNVLENEQKLTKVCFDMEREGVLIDRTYTEEAYQHEVTEYRRIEEDLNRIAGQSVDWLSAKQLKPIFDRAGEPYSYTEKGNASFDKDALEESGSELAKLILKYRYHYKRAHTYFENFLWLMDTNHVLHADAQQAGTGYGRMSYWTPNLQNVPKRSDKEETNYRVRRCFIPKPGTILADFDYSGAEYYMTMDYSRELPVIEQLKAGIDPHAELGKSMGLTREDAKTMQFRILYGGGKGTVGRALGYKGNQAEMIGKQKRDEFFRRMPRVAAWIKAVSHAAQSRGYIFNWLGRIIQYDRNTAYKASNGLIQGGVGDMTKVAMVRLFDKVLTDKKSKMILQVHDSILFKLYPDELDLIPIIKRTMEQAYPHKILPMATDVGFSNKSWAELTDEIPALA